jgi:hypothetical protein
MPHLRTLSEETLRWAAPRVHQEKNTLFPDPKDSPKDSPEDIRQKKEEEWQNMVSTMNQVRRALLDWQPGMSREKIFDQIKAAQGCLHKHFKNGMPDEIKEALLDGIDTSRTFQVTNLRPARRIGPRGEFLTEMVVEILQNKNALPYDPDAKKAEEARRRRAREERKKRGEEEETEEVPFRGGVTLIVSMDDYTVRYAIRKRPDSAAREARQREFLLRAGGHEDGDAAEYSSDGLTPGWYTRQELREKWFTGRTSDREDMRASSCACRRKDMEGDAKKKAEKAAKKAGIPVPNALTEPFALLHQG